MILESYYFDIEFENRKSYCCVMKVQIVWILSALEDYYEKEILKGRWTSLTSISLFPILWRILKETNT